MSDKNKDLAEPIAEQNESIELLLDSDDNLDAQRISDEYLTALGIDPSKLISEFADHLEKEAIRLEAEGAVSGPIHAALQSIRSRTDASDIKSNKQEARPGRTTHVSAQNVYWTNSSVKSFLDIYGIDKADDPVEVITQRARTLVYKFIEDGWSEVKLDPFALADYLKIHVVPFENVRDARTVSTSGRPVIEFNPNRPRARVRFSICHEIAHTLFPDYRNQIRYRATHEEMKADEWQLEMLCNVGAAEFLMPIGSFQDLTKEAVSIDKLLELRKQHEVSTEAILRRFAQLTPKQCIIFSASRKETGVANYRIEYSIASKTFQRRVSLPTGWSLPKDSVINECTAIGYTAKRHEQWRILNDDFYIECVGIPPYPNQLHTRVMGIAVPTKQEEVEVNAPTYLVGDATEPRGQGRKIIAQVVNDKASSWGGGFALVVRKKWPFVQAEFIRWADANKSNFALGNVHMTNIDDSLAIVHMICQKGYAPARKPTVRYAEMRKCLNQLANVAIEQQASVHMPRIGCGQAGGSWSIVKELIDQELCERGVKVNIYDLPNTKLKKDSQPFLDFSGSGDIS